MSGFRVNSFDALKQLIQDGSIVLAEEPVVPKLSSFVNVDVNTSIFITKFTKEDVDDFCDLLARYPAIKYKDTLGTLLEDELKKWIKGHQGRCPYEPFLWALKLTDNYFGSLANGSSEPDKTMLDPICKALGKIYVPDYEEIISNVLLNWDWYQPVHVIIGLYELLTTVDNPLMDEKLREYWLLHFMYTHNAYRCLLHKEMNEENAKAAIQHISHEKRTGINGSDFAVTKKDRSEFVYMFRRQPNEIKSLIRTLYSDRRHNCSKSIRAFLDAELIGSSDYQSRDSEALRAMQSYSLISDADERETARMNFSISLWQMKQKKDNPGLDYIVQEAPRYGLADSVVSTLLDDQFDYSTQFYILKILTSEADEYHSAIKRKYNETCASGISSDEGLLYECAYCIQGHPELAEKVTWAYYYDGYGLLSAQYVFNRVRLHFAQQVDESVKNIVSACKDNIDKCQKVIANCVKISSRKNSYIPVAFDCLIGKLVEASLTDTTNGYTYAKISLDLINNIATTAIRQRYYSILVRLYQSKEKHLASISKKANDIIRKLFPIA